jgi:hypothetical protein
MSGRLNGFVQSILEVEQTMIRYDPPDDGVQCACPTALPGHSPWCEEWKMGDAPCTHRSPLSDAVWAHDRIRDTPVPFPYQLIMTFICFVFINTTPFVYVMPPHFRVASTVILAAAFYGTAALGLQVGRCNYTSSDSWLVS